MLYLFSLQIIVFLLISVICLVRTVRQVDEARQDSLLTLMFADDIVTCRESRKQVKERLERWELSPFFKHLS